MVHNIPPPNQITIDLRSSRSEEMLKYAKRNKEAAFGIFAIKPQKC